MEFALKMIFEVLSYASIMVIIVLGLAVIISMMDIVNIAHAEFVMLGAYWVYLMELWQFPIWLAMMTAPLIVALLGIIVEKTIFRRLYDNVITGILASYALAIVLREGVRSLLQGKEYYVAVSYSGSIEVFGIQFSLWRMAIITITVIVIIFCYLLLTRTSVGLKVRGALDNPSLARTSGISTTRLYSLTFAFGAGLAGLAGAMIVPLYGISADLGASFLIQAFYSALLGGIGGFIEPVLGAVVVGSSLSGFQWLRNISGLDQFTSPVSIDVMVFLVILIVVKLRPDGIFTSKQ